MTKKKEVVTGEARAILPATFSAHEVFKDYAKTLMAGDPTLKLKSFNGKSHSLVVKQDGTVLISFKKFKDILASYNSRAGSKLISGYNIDLLNGLGYLYVGRIERTATAKPRLDKGASFKLRKKLKEEGTLTDTNWRVYFSDDTYIKVLWFKPSWKSSIVNGFSNIKYYSFGPAGGQKGKGFKHRLSTAVRHRPELQALYPYIVNKTTPIANGGLQ